jgi:WD40 repeat protein
VSVVLYNTLYRLVITCGYDSNILVWDPSTGMRRYFIKNAHTYEVYGIARNVEITAACCDPKNQQLVTGARDGTVKMWNFLDGICTRHLSIDPDCEVTSIYWITDRILATGQNGLITEFADQVDEVDYGRGKSWRSYHEGQIVCAVVQMPRLVITGSNRGELIFWDLKTGQPYRWHNVEDPKTLIEVYDDYLLACVIQFTFEFLYRLSYTERKSSRKSQNQMTKMTIEKSQSFPSQSF